MFGRALAPQANSHLGHVPLLSSSSNVFLPPTYSGLSLKPMCRAAGLSLHDYALLVDQSTYWSFLNSDVNDMARRQLCDVDEFRASYRDGREAMLHCHTRTNH
jgi:hypothetical protein